MGRAPCCDKANVKKGPWSPEEDAKLKAYIDKNGTGGNWIALPPKIGLKRCGKSCRLRWLNYLRPNIKHGGFTEEEDNLICSLYISIGSRWSIIAAQLPGRTDNDIKNYWNTRLKKKLLGKQRKDHRVICPNKQESSKKPHNNFNFSDQSFGLYPLPPPPFCVAYPTQTTTQIKDQPPISGDLISHFGERSYPYDGLINTIPTTLYTSDVSFSTLPPLTSNYYAVDGGAALDHFEETNVNIFGQIDEVFINNNVNPRELHGMENFSSASQERCSWRDINSVIYSSSISSYEVSQQ